MTSRKSAQQPLRRRRGAPLASQNARTHGFYSSHFTEKEQDSFQTVRLNGLQAEIGLLRLRIRCLASYPNASPHLLFRAINVLVRTISMPGSARHITKSASPLRILVLSLKFTLNKVEGPVLSFVEGKETGIVFPYFQNFGPFLALEVDITLETIPLLRHDAAPPLNVISRLTTVFTTYKKRLMSSAPTSPGPPTLCSGRAGGLPLRCGWVV